jgi:hypothetical protein
MVYFERPPRYRSFLITMWQERSRNPDVPAVWRFRMEDPHTGQQRGFVDFNALVAALQREIDDSTAEERGGN